MPEDDDLRPVIIMTPDEHCGQMKGYYEMMDHLRGFINRDPVHAADNQSTKGLKKAGFWPDCCMGTLLGSVNTKPWLKGQFGKEKADTLAQYLASVIDDPDETEGILESVAFDLSIDADSLHGSADVVDTIKSWGQGLTIMNQGSAVQTKHFHPFAEPFKKVDLEWTAGERLTTWRMQQLGVWMAEDDQEFGNDAQVLQDAIDDLEAEGYNTRDMKSEDILKKVRETSLNSLHVAARLYARRSLQIRLRMVTYVQELSKIDIGRALGRMATPAGAMEYAGQRVQGWVELPMKMAALLGSNAVLKRLAINLEDFGVEHDSIDFESDVRTAESFQQLVYCSMIEEAWGSTYFRYQWPHSLAETCQNDKVAAQRAMDTRKVEWEALLHTETLFKDGATNELKLLKDTPFIRSQLVRELAAVLESVGWKCDSGRWTKLATLLYANESNTKHQLEDIFGDAKKENANAKGRAPGPSYTNVALIEAALRRNVVSATAAGPRKNLLQLTQDDWSSKVPHGHNISVSSLYNPPSYNQEAKEAFYEGKDVDFGVPFVDRRLQSEESKPVIDARKLFLKKPPTEFVKCAGQWSHYRTATAMEMMLKLNASKYNDVQRRVAQRLTWKAGLLGPRCTYKLTFPSGRTVYALSFGNVTWGAQLWSHTTHTCDDHTFFTVKWDDSDESPIFFLCGHEISVDANDPVGVQVEGVRCGVRTPPMLPHSLSEMGLLNEEESLERDLIKFMITEAVFVNKTVLSACLAYLNIDTKAMGFTKTTSQLSRRARLQALLLHYYPDDGAERKRLLKLHTRRNEKEHDPLLGKVIENLSKDELHKFKSMSGVNAETGDPTYEVSDAEPDDESEDTDEHGGDDNPGGLSKRTQKEE